MTQPSLDPGDAPFSTTVIPTGWDRPLTQAEADAANTLYPVPPYGDTYFPPGTNPDPPQVNARFLKMAVVTPGVTTVVITDKPELLQDNLIFPLWPIEGVLGIVDDVGVRPVRILNIDPGLEGQFTINYDTTGLDTTGLVLLGVIYVGP